MDRGTAEVRIETTWCDGTGELPARHILACGEVWTGPLPGLRVELRKDGHLRLSGIDGRGVRVLGGRADGERLSARQLRRYLRRTSQGTELCLPPVSAVELSAALAPYRHRHIRLSVVVGPPPRRRWSARARMVIAAAVALALHAIAAERMRSAPRQVHRGLVAVWVPGSADRAAESEEARWRPGRYAVTAAMPPVYACTGQLPPWLGSCFSERQLGPLLMSPGLPSTAFYYAPPPREPMSRSQRDGALLIVDHQSYQAFIVGRIEECFDSFLRGAAPGTRGAVVMRIEQSADDRIVAQVGLEGTTLRDPALVCCLTLAQEGIAPPFSASGEPARFDYRADLAFGQVVVSHLR